MVDDGIDERSIAMWVLEQSKEDADETRTKPDIESDGAANSGPPGMY